MDCASLEVSALTSNTNAAIDSASLYCELVKRWMHLCSCIFVILPLLESHLVWLYVMALVDMRFAALLRAKSQFISQCMTFSQDIDRAAKIYLATQWKVGSVGGLWWSKSCTEIPGNTESIISTIYLLYPTICFGNNCTVFYQNLVSPIRVEGKSVCCNFWISVYTNYDAVHGFLRWFPRCWRFRVCCSIVE